MVKRKEAPDLEGHRMQRLCCAEHSALGLVPEA
jgi:hypothetical protein